MPAMSTETGPLLAGRYRLTGRLGSGGMARVHRAVDEVLGRQVAVKVLPTDSPEEALARFRREARVGAQLNHPNVVAIWDSEATESSILIAMEYVEGETLEDRAGGGPIPPEEAIPILEQIASALDHLHAAGVVHRDVKPSNVLVRPDGIAKLSDLGIAVSEEVTEITASGSVVGTLRYLSPERIQGEAAEPASDVYALAVTAFEALSGRQPFESTTPPALLNEIEKGDLDLREGLPGAPAAAAVLERGMARDPAERPGSAGALIDQLRTAYGHPEAAPPPPPPPTEPTAVLSAAPPEPPPIPTARRRSRSRVPAVLALLAVAAVGAALAFAALGGDDEQGTSPRGSGNQANAGGKKAPAAQQQTEEPAQTEETQPEPPAETAASEEEALALNDEGYALIQAGDPGDAIPKLEAAVRGLEPGTLNYGYALFNLANAYRLSGQPDKAIPLLEERLTIPDQLDEVRAELALARAEAGGGEETDD
jgi:serine/threonine protein kinase